MIALLNIFAAQEYDRAAEVRAHENNAMRALFADVAASLPDPDLRKRLEKASANQTNHLKYRR